MSEERRRAVIYCRISDDREGRRYGVQRQEEVCRSKAEKNGWEIVAVLSENDLSAYTGKRRPKYEQLLTMLRSGEADAVVALSGKRLQRDWRDAFAFLDLAQERDIAVDTIKAGRYNLNTAEGRGQARRAAIDAQEESEEIGERVRDAKADNVSAGTYRGGPRPFAFEKDGMTVRSLRCPQCVSTEAVTGQRECVQCGAACVLVEGSEAWHLARAHDRIIAGESLRSICRDWSRAGLKMPERRYRNKDGSRTDLERHDWTPVALRRTLLRARNAGLIETAVKAGQGTIAGRAAWPEIVSEEKWRQCQALLSDPGRRTNTGATALKWQGTGLYRCHCGETVIRGNTRTQHKTKINGGGQLIPAYRCRTGKHVVRVAELVDEYVSKVAISLLMRQDAATLFLPPSEEKSDQEDLPATANALRAKLDAFANDYAADLITREQMLKGTAATRERLTEIEVRMAERAADSVLTSIPLGSPEVAQLWDGYHLDKRRAIIDSLMTVTLMPARRGRPRGFVPGSGAGYFDPESVRVEPRYT